MRENGCELEAHRCQSAWIAPCVCRQVRGQRASDHQGNPQGRGAHPARCCGGVECSWCSYCAGWALGCDDRVECACAYLISTHIRRARNVSQHQWLPLQTDGTGDQYRQSIPKAARLRHPRGLLAAGTCRRNEPAALARNATTRTAPPSKIREKASSRGPAVRDVSEGTGASEPAHGLIAEPIRVALTLLCKPDDTLRN